MFIARNPYYFNNNGENRQKSYVQKMENIIKQLTDIVTVKTEYAVSEKQAEDIVVEENILFENFYDTYGSWRTNAKRLSSIDELMYVGTLIDTYTSLYEKFEDKISSKLPA